MTPEVSVVLPCYRSATLAVESVYRLDAFFRDIGMASETNNLVTALQVPVDPEFLVES